MPRSSPFALEVDIEEDVVKFAAEYLGIVGSKLKIGGDTGFPDRIFWFPGGKPFLIEFKKPGEEPEPKQVYQHNKLRNLGYRVEVHDDYIEAIQALCSAVDTEKASHEGLKVLSRARRRCAFLSSRRRKDFDKSGSNQVPKRKRRTK